MMKHQAAYPEPNVSVGFESVLSLSQPDMSSIIFFCLSLRYCSIFFHTTHFLLPDYLVLALLLSAPSARCFCFVLFFLCTFWVELKNYADDCPSLGSLRISLPPSGLIIVLGFLLFPEKKDQPDSFLPVRPKNASHLAESRCPSQVFLLVIF
jgi:hypothetical protein